MVAAAARARAHSQARGRALDMLVGLVGWEPRQLANLHLQSNDQLAKTVAGCVGAMRVLSSSARMGAPTQLPVWLRGSRGAGDVCAHVLVWLAAG